MKSRASISSHPIHPMLVSLPIGLWTGSLAYDLAAQAKDGDAELKRSANDMMLAGIVGALAAAVPGIIDYLAIIPSESSSKKRGATHGLLNVTATALYGLNWLLRTRSPERWGRRLGTPLSFLGFGTVLYSGWLGGSMVYQDQIAVEHACPGGTPMLEGGPIEATAGAAVEVARRSEFESSGQTKLVHLNGHRIVVARSGERIVAFQDHCTHEGGPLSDGVLACGAITCPWHGSQFDVETGEVLNGPAEEQVRVYPIALDGDSIRITAPEPLRNATIADASGLLAPGEALGAGR
jgi:nitrite reductase/ring-hydroxylating ferredoxin subunit/uncharacterized membrane protein